MPQDGAELLLDGGPSEAGSGSGGRSGTWVRWKNLGADGERLLRLLLLLAYLLLPLGLAGRGAPPGAPAPLGLLSWVLEYLVLFSPFHEGESSVLAGLFIQIG